MKEAIVWRLFGLGCLVIAALAGWWGIWEPLQQAIAQDPGVRYRIPVFILVPFAAVYGLFFLIFGGRLPYRDPVRQRFTTAGWIVLLLAGVVSGASFWWFKGRMDALGYAYSGAAPAPKATPFQYVPPPKVPTGPRLP